MKIPEGNKQRCHPPSLKVDIKASQSTWKNIEKHYIDWLGLIDLPWWFLVCLSLLIRVKLPQSPCAVTSMVRSRICWNQKQGNEESFQIATQGKSKNKESFKNNGSNEMFLCFVFFSMDVFSVSFFCLCVRNLTTNNTRTSRGIDFKIHLHKKYMKPPPI